MKLDAWKDVAARKVGSVLASDAAMKVVGDPRVQAAMMRALNARGELREAVERRVSTIATAFDLATHDDVAGLRRTIRNLEDTVDELRDELEVAQAAAESASAAAVRAADAAERAQRGDGGTADGAAAAAAPAKRGGGRRKPAEA